MLYKPLKDQKRVHVLEAPPVQRFTPKMLAKGRAEGWLKLEDGLITLKGLRGEDVVYKIVGFPGYYSCYDNAMMPDRETGLRYIKEKFPGQPSPDPSNPLGIRYDNFYTAVLLTKDVAPETGTSLIDIIKNKIIKFFEGE